jgi:hypothetical protein
MTRKGYKAWIIDQMDMNQSNSYNDVLVRKSNGEDVQEEIDVMKIRHRHERYRTEMTLSMIPDNKADVDHARREETKEVQRKIALNELWFHRQREMIGDIHNDLMGNAVPETVPEFHADPQNIHRAETVNEVVKKTIQKVITIPVPEGYAWNMTEISKTPGEIIAECKLSIPAGKLLIDKYTSEETIYDMVPGIYGKTLDSVWQFVKGHEDKTLLIKTLKTELEDNIGMCAQGNLSRLCNVLQGYVDGLSVPPVAEILGDLFPPLMEIECSDERRERGLQIMRTHNVPDDEQDEWLNSLMA